MRIIKEHGPTICPQQRCHVRDQNTCGFYVQLNGFFPIFFVHCCRRSDWGRVHCRMRPKINFAPAIKNGAAQMRHCIGVIDVHWCQCGLSAFVLDPIIKLLKRASCACNSNYVMRGCKRFCQSSAKTARSASDKCNFLIHSSAFARKAF